MQQADSPYFRAEIDAFLALNRRSYLFADSPDGVRGWPMVAFYRPGTLWFTTYGKSPKVRHLQAASQATVLVATAEGVEPVLYAVVQGAVSVRQITPDMVDGLIAGRAPNTNSTADKDAHFRARLMQGKRVLVEVAIEQASMHELDGAAM